MKEKKGITRIMLVAIVTTVLVIIGIILSIIVNRSNEDLENSKEIYNVNTSLSTDEINTTNTTEITNSASNISTNEKPKKNKTMVNGYLKEDVSDLIKTYRKLEDTTFDNPAQIGEWIELTKRDKDGIWKAYYIKINKVTSYEEDSDYVENSKKEYNPYKYESGDVLKLDNNLYVVDYSIYFPSHFETHWTHTNWYFIEKKYNNKGYDLQAKKWVIKDPSDVSYIEMTQRDDRRMDMSITDGDKVMVIEPDEGKIKDVKSYFVVDEIQGKYYECTKDSMRISAQCPLDGTDSNEIKDDSAYIDVFLSLK